MPLRNPRQKSLSFDYQIVRSQRKTTAIYIRNGLVEVRTSKRTPARHIDVLVQEKSVWIEKKLQQQAQAIEEKISFQQGAAIPFMGRHYNLQLENTLLKDNVNTEDDRLTISCSATGNTPQQVYSLWLKQQAQKFLPQLTNKLAEKLGVAEDLSRIQLRNTKTKWGHCTSKGVIQYNWLIMMAPEPVIHYLVSHEVSHLKIMDHSPLFWQTVEQLDPDFLTHRKWLRQNQHRLHLDLA